MGMLDFVSGVGATGAAIGLDVIKSQVEEEKQARLLEIQNRYQVGRDQAHFAQQTGERLGAEQATVTRDATKRTADLEDAPKLAGYKTAADIATEKGKRELPAAQVSAEDKALKEAQARLTDAQTRRWDAEAEFTRGGKGKDGGIGRATAQMDKDAKLASSEIGNAIKNEKDENGAPKYNSQAILQFKTIAGAMARSGQFSPQEAASIARDAPILTQADVAARVAEEEKKQNRVGMFRGMITGGNVESGDIQRPDGTTMKIEDWRKQAAAHIMAESDKALVDWARAQGIQMRGAAPAGGGAPAAGGPTPEAIDFLRKNPENADQFRDKYGVDPAQYLPKQGAAGQSSAPVGGMITGTRGRGDADNVAVRDAQPAPVEATPDVKAQYQKELEEMANGSRMQFSDAVKPYADQIKAGRDAEAQQKSRSALDRERELDRKRRSTERAGG
jgi:hypothetical protein